MSTTAILTSASRVTFQSYDGPGVNLVGGIFILQTTKIEPKKVVPKISITNSESPPRRREFAPGNQDNEFNVSGICDQPGNWDVLWTNIMDGAFYAQVVYFVAKLGLAGIVTPLAYTAKTLFTEVALNSETSDEGSVLKFTANGTVLGSFTRSVGSDVIFVTGI